MASENPFLIREQRQLARRPRAVQSSILTCLGLMVAVLWYWIVLYSRPHAVMLWLLGALHGVLCMIAAGYGGYRIFAAEHFRATLDSVLLLPYAPLKWLLLKLAFPLWAILLAWSTALPLYCVAVLYNLVQPHELIYLLHKPLLAGVGALAIATILTPDFLERAQRAGAARANPAGAGAAGAGTGRPMDINLATFWWLMLGFVYALGVGLPFGAGLAWTERAFYMSTLPEFMFWVVFGVAFGAAAVMTAVAAVVRNDQRERLAHVTRLIALAIIYYGALGLVWGALNWWMRWGMPLVFPLFLLIDRFQGERPKESRAEQEVQWIAARWDNPLFIHDMRVYTRSASIRRSFLWMASLVVLSPALLLGLAAYWGPSTVWSGVGWGACQGIVQGLFMIWIRPKMFWHKEWAGQTLPLLLLTPLRSDEILLGRLLAAPLYHLAGMAPLGVIPLAALAWATWQGYWIAAPVALALSPLFLSCGVWLCCSVARHSLFSIKVLLGDLITILLRLLQGAILAACVFLALAGLPPSLGIGMSLSPLSPLAGWMLGLLLFCGNTVLAWAWFRLRVRQLELFRQGDIEVPESKVLTRNP